MNSEFDALCQGRVQQSALTYAFPSTSLSSYRRVTAIVLSPVQGRQVYVRHRSLGEVSVVILNAETAPLWTRMTASRPCGRMKFHLKSLC